MIDTIDLMEVFDLPSSQIDAQSICFQIRERDEGKLNITLIENDGRVSNGLSIKCSRCDWSWGDIIMRGGVRFGHSSPSECLSIKDMGSPSGSEIICSSCSFDESESCSPKWCADCQLCDQLSDSNGNTYRGTFIDDSNEFPIFSRCYTCHSIHLEECAARLNARRFSPSYGMSGVEVCYDFDEPYMACLECGGDWFGAGESCWDCVCMVDDVVDDVVDDIYDGEFENSPEPENNSEKANQIKDTIKTLGEEIFDIQDSINEGKYLKIMNLLQKVTNDINAM
jgi:hypothetical protein